jgi:hypothetical protein
LHGRWWCRRRLEIGEIQSHILRGDRKRLSPIFALQ